MWLNEVSFPIVTKLLDNQCGYKTLPPHIPKSGEQSMCHASRCLLGVPKAGRNQNCYKTNTFSEGPM